MDANMLTIASLVIAWLTVLLRFVKTKKEKARAKRIFWIASAVIGLAVGVSIWIRLKGGTTAQLGEAKPASPILFERANAERALKRTLVFEMLTIYEHPEDFESKYRSQLTNYWLSLDQGGKAIELVERAVARLNARGEKYGTNATLDELDFLETTLGDETATIQTREHWFLPVVDRNGIPRSGRDISDPKKDWRFGYKMRRINGHWLMVESTAPYKEGP